MSNSSCDMLWELTKRQSCFIVKRGDYPSTGVTFSADPMNLTKQNSFKASGLANTKAIGVKGNSLLFKTKRGTVSKITFKRCNATKIENVVCQYRVDLSNQAVKAISRSFDAEVVPKAKKARGPAKE